MRNRRPHKNLDARVDASSAGRTDDSSGPGVAVMSETQTRSVTSARRDPTIPRCGPTTSHEDDVEIDSADEDSFLVLFGEVELTSPERRLDDIDPFDTATMTIPIDALTAGLPMEEAIEMTGSHSIPP